MDFVAWTRVLSARDLQVVPPSHSVPVELWALRQDGGVLHFRCRGRSVRLVEYADDAIVLAEPASTCGCGCGLTAKLPESTPRLRLAPDARPTRMVEYVGPPAAPWTGHQAGLLRVPEAAALFDQLLAELDRHPAEVRVSDRSRPVVPGR